MSSSRVAVAAVPTGAGPHPAGSPYDRDLGRALGVSAFGLYEVDLPAGAETVEHDHVEDRSEDAYVVLAGSGVVVVDGEELAVAAGDCVAVTPESTRLVRAGADGLRLLAVCAP